MYIYRIKKYLYKLNIFPYTLFKGFKNSFLKNIELKKATVHMFHRAKCFNPQLLNLELNCTVLFINTQTTQKHYNVIFKLCTERKRYMKQLYCYF